jgi:excisionase family DNA binding protein
VTPDPPPPPALLTTSEAARRLGLHPKTLTNYVRKGRLKPTMRLPSGQYRWDLDDIRRQLAEQQSVGQT